MEHKDFLDYIEVEPHQWDAALSNNKYEVFKIPKSAGKYRIIEAPDERLKWVQRRLAVFFQEQYGKVLPDCVQGFVPNDIHDGVARSVLTNAQAHIGADYVWNVDLKDFFYQVGLPHINAILKPMPLHSTTKKHIRRLVLKEQRLPMGAPTSPVLSNWAFIKVDEALSAYVANQNMTYTRYVDDLTFSSAFDISDALKNKINGIITDHHFEVNPKKIKYYPIHITKVITGILLKDHQLSVSDDLIEKMHKNMKVYARLERMRQGMNDLGIKQKAIKNQKWKHIKASIKGQLNFVKTVEGKSSPLYISMKKQYKKAQRKRSDFEFTVYF